MRRLRVPILLSLLTALPTAAAAETRIDGGHYEIHIDYTATPGNPDAGWKFSVSYDEDNDFSSSAGVVRLDPATSVLVAGDASARTTPDPPTNPYFARFGPPGTPMWILPQNQLSDVLFLGVRTTMSPGIFRSRIGNTYNPSGQGSISLRLISVEGPGVAAGGHFATWKFDNGDVISPFDTTDGVTATDEIPTIPVSSHTHYNWGFTQPGRYYVTFEAFGRLISPDVLTSGRATFTFEVGPQAVPEPASFSITSIRREDGQVFLEWPAPLGVTDPTLLTDVVQRSPDLAAWTDLINPPLEIVAGSIRFAEPAPAAPYFYRIKRN